MYKEFETHRLNESGLEKAAIIGGKFADLLGYCKSIGEQGREISLVATKLEEACFFAKKAMAVRPENQETK